MGSSTFNKLDSERPPEPPAPTDAPDPNRRLIYLCPDNLSTEVAAQFMAALAEMSATPGLIRVVLTSTGGSEPAGWAIYDSIRQCPCPVVIDGIGAVWSMGVVVFLAGAVRRMSRECRLMVHAGTVHLESTVDQRTLVAFGDEAKKTNRRYQEVIAERTGLGLRKVAQLCEAETYLSAEQALSHGFIDAIIPYAGEQVTSKKRKRK